MAAKASAELGSVVDSLCQTSTRLTPPSRNNPCQAPLPSRAAVADMMEALRSVLFPGYFGLSDLSEQSIRYHVGSTLDRVLGTLRDQVQRGVCFTCTRETAQREVCERRAEEIVADFMRRLPHVQQCLHADVQAAYEGDPAATDPNEAIFCYPGVLALTNHRVAHELHQLGVPLLPRIINELAHSLTGIDIHPGAEIGRGMFIDHGTGVVIGETCIIGDRVRLYQGVTLGAKSFPLDEDGNPIKGIPRHPIVEDDVIIYAGATILGRVTIGKGSVIGGNVWLVRSVPPSSRISQSPAREEKYSAGGGI
ncbi:MAG: serine acetyltransferase [Deltaproteobacteria bacterium]|nr:serine acetyltransferase [Deltaproteobacteria bacterium]MBW2532112.1 serine acetyltransferase [Deltaproteobacteria bacterium]